MNRRRTQFTFVLALMGALPPLSVFSQGRLGNGTFQNLDFSAAKVVFIDNSNVAIETGPALPDWNVSIGGITPSTMSYNDYSLSTANVALFGPTPPGAGGNYAVVLQGGAFVQYGNTSLQQTGMAPVGANSIQFQSSTYPYYPTSINAFGFGVNGQAVNLVPFSNGNGWTYAGNISQYAGQSATLDFYSLSGGSPTSFYLSDITFSSQVIPEPAPLPLFGIGALALVARPRGRRN